MNTNPLCQTTHRQILRGTCPQCGVLICEGQIESNSDQVGRVSGRVWNIDVLESDLDSGDDENRMDIVSNLSLHGPPIDEAVPLFARALNDKNNMVRDYVCGALSRMGSKISHDQAAAFEKQVETSRHELALRLLLVGYYFLEHRKSNVARLARRNHILWLIKNAPEIQITGRPYCSLLDSEDQDGYDQCKSLWLANIKANPNKAAILANAASFFTLNDSSLSEQLLEQGASLQPDHEYWHKQLGHLYALSSRGEDQVDEMMAKKSFAAFEQAERLGETQESGETPEVDSTRTILMRIHSLPQLAKSAFDAGEFERAADYASELLSLSSSTNLREFFRNDGNAVHDGNLVLGRVALENGNVEEAKRHLLASGRTQGSPNLISFGPNMSLARDLLKCGERDVVLEYFELCRTFWEHDSDFLNAWTEQVKAGNIPDFGANLDY